MALTKRESIDQQGGKTTTTAVGDVTKWAENNIGEASGFQLVGLMECAHKKYPPKGSLHQMMRSGDSWAKSFAHYGCRWSTICSPRTSTSKEVEHLRRRLHSLDEIDPGRRFTDR